MVQVENTSEVTLSFDTIAAATAGVAGTSAALIVDNVLYELVASGGDITTSDGKMFSRSTAPIYATRALFVADVSGGLALNDGIAVLAGGYVYVTNSAASALPGLAGWEPFRGGINLYHFGATCDGTTLDDAAFAAAESYGASPVYITDNTRLTGPADDNIVYVLENNATVTDDSGNWYPREFREEGHQANNIQKVNAAANDDSPTITGSEYPISTTGLETYRDLINFWGAQHTDLNNSAYGRTAIDIDFTKAVHRGEGDMYNYRANGVIYRHGRFASITSPRGHNNIGMFNGQMNAGTDNVTLYAMGDMVLHDQGFDHVSQRGAVIIHYANGTDPTYDCDRFTYMGWSRGTNDIDVAFVGRGLYRTGLDLTDAGISSGSAVNLAQGDQISFDASGASTSSGYGATVFGDYSIKANASSQLEIGAGSGITLKVGATLQFRPAIDSTDAIRAFTAAGTGSANLGISGVGGQLNIRGPAATATTLSLQTQSAAGVLTSRIFIDTAGGVNVATAGGSLQMAGTKVVQAQRTGWSATTGTELRTNFGDASLSDTSQALRALIVDLKAHGLVAT